MCFLFICSVRCYILFGENCHWSPVLRFPSTSPKKCGAWWLNRWLLVNIIISSNLCCIYMHLPIPPNFFMTHDDYLLEWWGYLLEWSWMICQCRIPIRIFLMWHRVFFFVCQVVAPVAPVVVESCWINHGNITPEASGSYENSPRLWNKKQCCRADILTYRDQYCGYSHVLALAAVPQVLESIPKPTSEASSCDGCCPAVAMCVARDGEQVRAMGQRMSEVFN